MAKRENLRDALAHPGNGNGGNGGGHNGGSHSGNGGNGGGTATHPTLIAGRKDLLHETMPTNALNDAMARLMGDAPTCTCGSITVRNGSCYKCLNCGASLGCS
jgi:ribonucleoside-diphosphate reductase alpha chain